MSQFDDASFRALYDENYERIVAYVLRRAANAEDAADAVSETFLTAWRRSDVLPAGVEATMWLYATARRVLSNQQRSGERRRRLLDRIRQQPAPGFASLTETGVVADAFLRLRSDDQEILGLIAWEGLTHRQLGAVLGCSENAAKLRAARARRRFTSEISKVKDPPPGTTDPVADGLPAGATYLGGADE